MALSSYPVGNGAAHGGNERDASSTTVSDHLLCHCLGRHENTSDVDLKHRIGVFLSVLQGRSLLLDASCRNEAVQLALML